MATRSIDDVLAALDGVVEHAVREGNRIGYFAAVYRTVTAQVRAGMAAGFFDDADRMERLDVIFANRFLDALQERDNGGRPTRSWRKAFDAAERWRPIILQHLLAGINAHINLDLGVAAAQTAPGEELAGLRGDFDRINEILAGLMDRMRGALAAVSPWIGLLDRLGGRGDDELINFSLTVARGEAWRFASILAPLSPEQHGAPIRLRDERVARLADIVLRPGPLSAGLLLVRSRESSDVGEVIDTLTRLPPPSLAQVEARVREDRA